MKKYCTLNVLLVKVHVLPKLHDNLFQRNPFGKSKSQHIAIRKRMTRAHIVELNEPQLGKDNEPIDML